MHTQVLRARPPPPGVGQGDEGDQGAPGGGAVGEGPYLGEQGGRVQGRRLACKPGPEGRRVGPGVVRGGGVGDLVCAGGEEMMCACEYV